MGLYAIIIIAFLVFIVLAKGIVIVKQAEVMIVERMGKYHRTLDSGIHVIVPIFESARKINQREYRDVEGQTYMHQKITPRIDLRETVYDFPKQNVITKDNVTIEINALLYFQITDPVKATYEVNNFPVAIEKLTQTTLRNVIGELDLDETLASRDTINQKLRTILDEATDKWGVKVNRVELKDINPPKDIKNAMEKQMRAERDRRAAILEAEGKKKSEILKAEGVKKSKILEAEGMAEARLKTAKAEAKAIQLVSDGLEKTGTEPGDYLIAIKYIDAFREIIQKNDKTVLLPYEASGVLGSIESIKQMFNFDKDKGIINKNKG
ncbi:MAG: SPFH/Band 7/PHB domain protein [Candidatus Mcinerneyibacterium aminivorans]|uniref:SPFH/Band 7/PHB domain protein n=1 Tax=Candidatus Mcinerneyibacterium aminivorans TaxID=2703815 RepID=A0A5D0MIG4_9BACT|nr:MAG: SPFH/Band 7/PHB domain protein [Candidatus Mcinerneyibacterium aminivorans]